jgi:uncharacterized membrane protein
MTFNQQQDTGGRMEARQVSAGQGWRWIVDGFALFRKNPPIWIALFLIYFVMLVVVSMVPLVGPLTMSLLAPVFTAGFMLACRDVEKGEELELGYLIAGFKHHAGSLITVGGFYLVGSIIILGVMMLSGGGAILGAASLGQDAAAEPQVGAMGGMMIGLLVGLALLIPLVMAYWFAPALVVFHGAPALTAMKLSFQACLRNVVPFLVYGVICFILMVVAMIPFGLGMLVLIPTLNASIYTGYKDIFAISEEAAAGQ